MTPYCPEVLLDPQNRPVLVFAKGRVLFHAVVAIENRITLDTLETLRGLRPLTFRGEPYPVKRAANFWLRKDWREITPKAKAMLRRLRGAA